ESGRVLGAKGLDKVAVCALGGSVATGGKLAAGVVEVKTFEELAALPEAQVKGRIVFFNRPMEPRNVTSFTSYSGAVNQRGRGAVEAAKRGAVAVLVRSMNLRVDDFPHTGAMRYADDVTKIPAAALSTIAADQLSAALKTTPGLRFELRMNCRTLPDAPSFNVIGEVRGATVPQEVIVVGGHLDSWDLAEGAHDDGAGCVQSIEVLRLLKASGQRPNRTVRAVLFANEENGTRGAQEYARQAKLAGPRRHHLAAIESDAGGFTPRGFAIEAPAATVVAAQAWRPLLAPYLVDAIESGHGGTDIEPLGELGTIRMGLSPDSQRYFDVHHAATDVFEAVNRRELELGGAAMAAMVWLISQRGL
ncbi:MAG: M20/M25/M40 family metallo-hydrolase, partial [Hymenobacteraceae bacterium]|nr:M20/M25/M40 family metallo-hydrolase [Hymenobacteraceae bacterium]